MANQLKGYFSSTYGDLSKATYKTKETIPGWVSPQNKTKTPPPPTNQQPQKKQNQNNKKKKKKQNLKGELNYILKNKT